jgi:hypothetical protein
MPDVRLQDVEMSISKDGAMHIKGVSVCYGGSYAKELLVSAENPVDECIITSTFIVFRQKDKKTRFYIDYADIIVNSDGFNLGSMQFTGEHLSRESCTLFFLHDLVSEVRYYHCMKALHRSTPFGVEYLRDRYKCIENRLRGLDFERMIACLDFNKKAASHVII